MRILWPLLLLAAGAAVVIVAGDPRHGEELGRFELILFVAGLLLVLREIAHLWRLSQPGSVDLAPFENATGDKDLEVQALAARVGYRLGALNVFRAPTLPSGSLDGLFVDVVASIPTPEAKWMSGLAALVTRLARPPGGHRVSAIALRGEHPPSCGLTATVADAATGKVTSVFTVWCHSYSVAADEIAYRVYQAVASSSAIRRRTPAWARFDAPEGASLKLFHDGIDAEERGDIEKAHDLYHAALEAEPANVLIQMRAGNSEELVPSKGRDTPFERMLAAAEHYARAKRLWPELTEPAYRLAISYGFLALQQPEMHVGAGSDKEGRSALDKRIASLREAQRHRAIDALLLESDLHEAHRKDHHKLLERVRVVAKPPPAHVYGWDPKRMLLEKARDNLHALDKSLRYRVQVRRLLKTVFRDLHCALRRDRGGTGQRGYYRAMLAPWPAGVKRRRARCKVLMGWYAAELRYRMHTGLDDVGELQRELEERIDRKRRWLCWGEIGWQARYNIACFYGIRAEDECCREQNVEVALKHLRKVITDPASSLSMRWLRRDPDLAWVREHERFTELFSRKSFDARPVVFGELRDVADKAASTWALRVERTRQHTVTLPDLDNWIRRERHVWELVGAWAASPEHGELRALLDAAIGLKRARDDVVAKPDGAPPPPVEEPSPAVSESNDALARHAQALAAVWLGRARASQTALLRGHELPRGQVATWVTDANLTWLALAEWSAEPSLETRRAAFEACVQEGTRAKAPPLGVNGSSAGPTDSGGPGLAPRTPVS